MEYMKQMAGDGNLNLVEIAPELLESVKQAAHDAKSELTSNASL